MVIITVFSKYIDDCLFGRLEGNLEIRVPRIVLRKAEKSALVVVEFNIDTIHGVLVIPLHHLRVLELSVDHERVHTGIDRITACIHSDRAYLIRNVKTADYMSKIRCGCRYISYILILCKNVRLDVDILRVDHRSLSRELILSSYRVILVSEVKPHNRQQRSTCYRLCKIGIQRILADRI